jgi:hypothetical protein
MAHLVPSNLDLTSALPFNQDRQDSSKQAQPRQHPQHSSARNGKQLALTQV